IFGRCAEVFPSGTALALREMPIVSLRPFRAVQIPLISHPARIFELAPVLKYRSPGPKGSWYNQLLVMVCRMSARYCRGRRRGKRQSAVALPRRAQVAIVDRVRPHVLRTPVEPLRYAPVE